MKKFIITCPECKKKIKISNKIAKYKCPSCKNIYKFNIFKMIYINIKSFFTKIIEAIRNTWLKIVKKCKDTVTTYKYLRQVRKHMKNDPNWSNFRKQENEMKELNPENSFKKFFKKFKKK